MSVSDVAAQGFYVSSDVGGTFTDTVVSDASGVLGRYKSEFGLVAGIWTHDLGRAHRVARRVRTGQVFVNNYGAGGGIELPFGGYRKSGIGREKGLAALDEYLQTKNVCVRIGG